MFFHVKNYAYGVAFKCLMATDGTLFVRAEDLAIYSRHPLDLKFAEKYAGLTVRDVMDPKIDLPKWLAKTRIFSISEAKHHLKGFMGEQEFDEMFDGSAMVKYQANMKLSFVKAIGVRFVERSRTKFEDFLAAYQLQVRKFFELEYEDYELYKSQMTGPLKMTISRLSNEQSIESLC